MTLLLKEGLTGVIPQCGEFSVGGRLPYKAPALSSAECVTPSSCCGCLHHLMSMKSALSTSAFPSS